MRFLVHLLAVLVVSAVGIHASDHEIRVTVARIPGAPTQGVAYDNGGAEPTERSGSPQQSSTQAFELFWQRGPGRGRYSAWKNSQGQSGTGSELVRNDDLLIQLGTGFKR